MSDTVQTLRMRQHDLLPMFTAVVEDDDGEPVNLSGASAAYMILRTVDGSPVFGANPNNLPLTADGSYRPQVLILAPLEGIVTYGWLPEETSTLVQVVYDVAVQAEWSDGRTLIAPTARRTQICVRNGWAPVPNLPPVAEFESTRVLLVAEFTSTSTDPDGTIVGWAWDFGDGTGSGEENPTHTYATGGTYTVTLTVTDDDGATGSVSHVITLPNNPPVAEFTWVLI